MPSPDQGFVIEVKLEKLRRNDGEGGLARHYL